MGAQALLGVACAVALGTLWTTGGAAEHVTRDLIAESSALHEARSLADELEDSAHNFLLTREDRYAALLRGGRVRFEAAIAPLVTQLPAEGRASFAASISTILDVPAPLQKSELDRYLHSFRGSIEQALRSADDEARRSAEERAAESTRDARKATIGLAVACALLLGTGLVVLPVSGRLSREVAELHQAQKVAIEAAASRRELLDVVAHDLRSPLNAIVLGLDVMRESNQVQPVLHPIENAAQRMGRMIEDLLDASRAQTRRLPLQYTAFRCVDALDATAEMFAESAKRAGSELRIECPRELEVVADRERSIQILANLVGNALRVSDRGSTITLAARRVAGGMRMSVRDHGPGIRPDDRERLFHSYTHGSARAGSLGLGLYISKTLVEAHGGRIGVDPNPGKGSTFWMEFPDRELPTRRQRSEV